MEDTTKIGCGCAVVLGAVAGVIWVVSLLGTGLTGFLGDVVSRIEALCPWRRFAAWFVFLAVFFGMHLSLLPFTLSHARVDRKTGQPTSALNEGHPTEVDLLRTLGLACLESVVLLIICRALAKPLGWTRHDVSMLLPFTGWLGKSLMSVALLIGDMILTLLLILASTRFVELLSRTEEGVAGPFLSNRDDEIQILTLILADVLVFSPVFILISIVYRSVSFLLTMFACFLLMKAFFAGVANFISLCLDWANERRASRAAT